MIFPRPDKGAYQRNTSIGDSKIAAAQTRFASNFLILNSAVLLSLFAPQFFADKPGAFSISATASREQLTRPEERRSD